MSPIRTTLLYALVPVVFTGLGAAVGVFLPWAARLRSYVLHLAAGVVFAVVAGDLLPEIQRRVSAGDVPLRDLAIGFALGIGTMLVVEWVVERVRGEHGDARDADDQPAAGRGFGDGPPRGAMPIGLLVAVAIDFLLDGLLLGVGFAAGAHVGVLLALAESAEQLSVGLALAGELIRAGVRPWRAVAVVSALGSLVFLAAALGATALAGLTGGPMVVVLSFGLAALLYLVTEELLREAHEERESALATAMFFVGFLAFVLIEATLP